MKDGKGAFKVLACSSIFFLFLFLLFLMGKGMPVLLRLPLDRFLFGTHWEPDAQIPSYGILPMLAGTCLVTAGAVVLGAPIGIMSAIYLKEYCPKKWHSFLLGMLEVMAGMPSVIYGYFGMVVLVPVIRRFGAGNGMSLVTAAVLLGFMILPTVIQVGESALRSVPGSIYEGARSLGASRERSIFFAELPAAASGITTAVVLGVSRAMGETMAVSMVAGNQARMPGGLLDGFRTLTAGIALEMGYAVGEHRDVLVAMGVVLLLLAAGTSGIRLLVGKK